MAYDLFISYSRRDNQRAQVSALRDQIEASFEAFAGRDLRVFFDTRAIGGMDDWRQKIQRSLRDSQLFLAVLSPNYLASPYCRWEWEDYVRYEAMRQCLSEGVAPVFFVKIPGPEDKVADAAIARWVAEIHQRQPFDLGPWHERGEQALKDAHVKEALTRLHQQVRERLDRSERARRSPANLIRHNPAFVGRVRELSNLRDALSKNQLGLVGTRQATGPVTVQGLGGMGKTELALAYAHAFAWDYPGGRWQVPCEYIGDLRLALSQLSGPLGFEYTDDEQKDLTLQFERVLRELNQRERCLLLLDNVSDPALLEPLYLDRLPRDGKVDLIATTRLPPAQIPGSAQDQTFIAVDELPEEDALALLRSHQPEGRFADQVEDDAARAIVKLLEGFTLAVETAGIYLGRHPGPEACRRFHQRLKAGLLTESETAAGDATVAVRHRERLLEKTLAFTLETLSPEALHLLEFAALLPADLVAVPWLQSLGSAAFPAFSAGAEVAALPAAFREPLDWLLGLRLVLDGGVSDEQGQPRLVRMHRLVQELLRKGTEPQAVQAKQAAIDTLAGERDAVFEKTTRWETARWEIGPFAALAELWADTGQARAAWLLNQAGARCHALADWVRADPLLRRALAIDEASYGDDHPNVATDLNNLAQLLKATNRLAAAEPLMRRALAIWEKSLGKDHPNVASALNNLAQLLKATNRLAAAEPLLRRALAILEESLGKDHPEVATALNNLAQLLQDTNRLAAAEPLLRRALAIDEASYGDDHPNVARDLNNLAQLLQATNRLADAEPLMRRALAIDEASYGKDDPNVATDLNNLALLLRATNRLAEAEPPMRRALAIDEASYGDDHPNVAIRLNNLAALLQATNRLAAAEPLLRRALAIDEASYGKDDPDVATKLNNLAALLQATNRLAEAEPLMRRVVKIFLQFGAATGHQHPHCQAALANYGALLKQMGRAPAEVTVVLDRVLQPFGLRLGKQENPSNLPAETSENPRPSQPITKSHTSVDKRSDNSMEPTQRVKAFEDLLRQEGYQPKAGDTDNFIYFKKEGKTYVIANEQEDELFFRLIFAGWWTIESPDERRRAEAAALHATAHTKVAKVFLVDDKMWASIELFLASPELLSPILERCLSALQTSVANFVEQMRKGAK